MIPFLPSPQKQIWHERDIEYFNNYAQPIFANIQRMHYTNVNSTIPYFGPMLYLLVRQLGCEKVLEIGHAEGYSSFYLAHGVNDNAIRFNMLNNHYYGIDIVQTEKVREALEKEQLPITILNKDSMTLDSNSFPGVVFDMIFQDGCHDAEHVIYEFKAMWKQLRGHGNGYWVAHDAEGPAWEGCNLIKKQLIIEKIPHEMITFGGQYGLMIIRNMEGFDYTVNPWKD
jgi:protein-L-isoaspartate O-methyltransferase